MSFELLGKIRIKDDGATRTLDKVRRQTDRARRATDELAQTSRMAARAQEHAAAETRGLARMLDHAKSAAIGTGRAVRSSAGMMSGAARSTAGLTRQVAALGAAYVTARGAKSLFDKTIGAASQYESREVTVKAMFGKESEKNARQYLDFVQSRADVSMFTMDDFLDAGKSFIPTTKDIGQIKRMVNLAERLGAMDSEAGIAGGAYALREYFSGDAVSLVERFELPRSVLNQWKNLPLNEQLDNLDRYLTKIGASNELLEAQSKTTLGQYRKSIGQINRAFREMGTEGLRKINPLLQDFNKWLNSADFAKLKAWGTDVFSGLVSGAVDAVRRATSWINEKFINNPEFQNLETIKQKIAFVFDAFGDEFRNWWSASGKTTVTAAAEQITEVVASVLKNSKPVLDAAIRLGAGIGEGIRQGIMSTFELPEAVKSLVPGGNTAQTKRLVEFNQKMSEADNNTPMYGGPSEMRAPQPKSLWGSLTDAVGFNGGIRNVPYNNMPARLHAGEAVLTREEAKRWRGESGANGGSSARPFTINISSMVVREEADIEKIAGGLARLLAQ
ncbi:hypothetical protein [Paenibacillus sp. HGF5]|uniref:hypothetical protein n=1 Tax=Paenibacillus sp. HGF5 TaxID=908341 RepID=UPI0002072A1A|nr:hypothetical protein [Paenibacillus sp. HGF5]EGG36571.1 conserved domain protein [Paenibacillus sp. HGF5]